MVGIDPTLLRQSLASPAAQAILSHAPANPDEQAAIDAYKANVDQQLAQNPQHQVAQAIRAALARGQTGLTMGDYSALSPAAQGKVTHWESGTGSLPPQHVLPQGNSAISAAIAGGHSPQHVLVGNDGAFTAEDGTSISPADLTGDKASYYADKAAGPPSNQRANIESDAATLTNMMQQLGGMGVAEKATALQGGDAAIPSLAGDQSAVEKYLGQKVADSHLLAQGYKYVPAGEALMHHTAPGWHLPDGTAGNEIRKAGQVAQANADANRADNAPREAAKAFNAQQLITKRAQGKTAARDLRMSGVDPAIAALSAQGGTGYNPMLAAAVPALGQAQLAGINAANETTKANAAQTEANARDKEFSYATGEQAQYQRYADNAAHGGQQPMSIDEWRALQGRPQQSAAAIPPETVSARIQPGTPATQIIDQIVNSNPSPADIKRYSSSLAGKLNTNDLIKLREELDPNNFSALGHLYPFNKHYQQPENLGPLNAAGILGSESPEETQLRRRKLQIIDQLLGNIGITQPAVGAAAKGVRAAIGTGAGASKPAPAIPSGSMGGF